MREGCDNKNRQSETSSSSPDTQEDRVSTSLVDFATTSRSNSFCGEDESDLSLDPPLPPPPVSRRSERGTPADGEEVLKEGGAGGTRHFPLCSSLIAFMPLQPKSSFMGCSANCVCESSVLLYFAVVRAALLLCCSTFLTCCVTLLTLVSGVFTSRCVCVYCFLLAKHVGVCFSCATLRSVRREGGERHEEGRVERIDAQGRK